MAEATTAPIGVELVEWHWLRPHHQRDALWVVTESILLEDVGAALSRDDADQVRCWLGDNSLRKPFDSELKRWEDDPTLSLRMLIVQPFVLVQEKTDNKGES